MKVAMAVVIAVLVLIAFQRGAGAALSRGSKRLLAVVERLGPLGKLLFVASYSTFDLCTIPPVPLAIGGGALFGPVVGVFLVLGSGLCSATVSFLIGRLLLRQRLQRLTNSSMKIQAIDRVLGRHGLQVVLLIRILHMPIPAVNYWFGCTSVPYRVFLLATAIGYLPTTLAFVLAGAAGKAVVEGPSAMSLQGLPLPVLVALVLAGAALLCWILVFSRSILQEIQEVEREIAKPGGA